MITLKSCEEEDLKDLRLLYNSIFENDDLIPKFQSTDKFEETLLAEKIYFARSLVAFDDDGEGKLVGFIFVSNRNKTAHIFSFGVIEEVRGTGIGKRLLNRLVRDLIEIEEISKIQVEIHDGAIAALNLFENYGFKKIRKLYTLYRLCPERESVKSKFDILTEFPSEILKNYNIYHQTEQPWVRSYDSLMQYNTKVIGYSILFKGKLLAYVLVGFDHTILDIATKTIIDDNDEHVYALFYHLFTKFDNLITVDLPEDDELFKVFMKTNFEVAYTKDELHLIIKQSEE